MAAKTKSKKTVTPLKDVEEPLKEVNNDGVTDAPYDLTADTDIQKRVQEEIDTLYPRTILGMEGILDAVLRELIRARLSR